MPSQASRQTGGDRIVFYCSGVTEQKVSAVGSLEQKMLWWSDNLVYGKSSQIVNLVAILQKELQPIMRIGGWWCNDTICWLCFIGRESRCINIIIQSETWGVFSFKGSHLASEQWGNQWTPLYGPENKCFWLCRPYTASLEASHLCCYSVNTPWTILKEMRTTAFL